MRVGKTRSRVGEDEVAGQRELEPARVADAVHSRDHRLRQAREPVDYPRLEARIDRLAGAVHAKGAEIRSGTEGLAAAAQDDTPDAVRLPFERSAVRLERLEARRVERIQLVRSIQRQRAQ